MANGIHFVLKKMLFVICVIFFVSPLSVSSQSLPPAEILLRFQAGLPEPSQLLLPWRDSNSSSAHCQWPGVSCYSSEDFEVKSLNLTGYGLSGVLEESISNLCQLPHLLSLYLSHNNFTGSIPSLLGNCTELNVIYLYNNSLTGSIPPELFRSGKLIELDLGFNRLSGVIPPEVSQCNNLKQFGVDNNLLSGKIPSALFSLTNLEVLYLGGNDLRGSLPDFPSPCSLSDLQIYKNPISGSLPLSLGNCHNLTNFDASSNNLGGTISPGIFENLLQLEFLYLTNNRFEGEIPETLWNARKLQNLSLAENNFNGTVSDSIGNFHMLTYLDLSINDFTGQIPKSIGSLRDLRFLYIYKTKLSGPLPPDVGNCSSLTEINVQENLISGSIPPEICKVKNLKIFRLSSNQIEGHIPQCMDSMKSLVELDFYNNRMIGTIPTGFGDLTNLTFLSLAENKFTGEVPSNLGRYNIPGLKKLDLTGNNFKGQIPSGVCTGNNLLVLTVGNNRFRGNFPEEITKCKSLYRLILRDNLLQGRVPINMANDSNISHFDISGNLFEGSIPRVIGLWSNLSTIDLSRNNFSGSIPHEFGRIQKLKELKISSNRLTGKIPPELGSLRMIELDLSKNGLSGEIPSAIISSSTLRIIQLQENNLTGAIPDIFSGSQSLKELQIGKNNLEGNIPCSISKVRDFNSVLNLSMNMLSGEIPKCIHTLDKLLILDISSNNFSGEIPPEVSQMKTLSLVNISFNHFSGQVPTGWAKILDSDPRLALGNPQLCLMSTRTNSCRRGRRYHMNGKMLGGILAGVVFLIICILAATYKFMRRIPQPSSPNQPLTEDLPDNLTFDDILHTTEGWDDKYVIGKGKHGTVYRVESVKSKKTWAVKKVELSNAECIIEMRTLSWIRHRNVLRMGGYSIRGRYGFILTEYMSGGTLYDLLHGRKTQVALDWETHSRIALGIAQGLAYLHHDCVPSIIHRDIKSDNILLDSGFEPKIGDFGIAKFDSDIEEGTPISAIVGTLGYIAPENAYSTRLTEKCDVYSYGVILLELLCRKLPVDPCFEEGLDIVFWVRKNMQSSNDTICCLDEGIGSWDEVEQQKAKRVMDIAIQCTELSPEIRPSMREVVGSLLELCCKQRSSASKTEKSHH